GGADATRFTLTNGVLAFLAPPDFESPSDADQNNTYAVVLRATDTAGNRTDRSVTVTVQNLNEPPDHLELIGGTVPENSGEGRMVGRLQGKDPDRADRLAFRLLSAGPGFPPFKLQGDRLVTTESLDHETTPEVRIRVAVSDPGGLALEREFLITVTDENDAPRVDGVLPELMAVYRQEFRWIIPETSFADPDAQQRLRFSVSGLPRGLSFDAANRSILGNPWQIGDFPLTVVARDSGAPPREVSASVVLRVVAAASTMNLMDLEQRYDGRPKPVRVVTEPAGLEVEVTYAGSRTVPILPGSYPVVAYARDPNIAGLVTGTLTISMPSAGHSLVLNPACPMVVEEDSGAPVWIPSAEDLIEVRGPDGNRLDLDSLRSRRMTLRLIFDSFPRDAEGRTYGHLERHQEGVWSPVQPTGNEPLRVLLQEWESGLLVFVPDPEVSGMTLVAWPFEAELIDALGVRLASAGGGRIDLSVRNRPDAPRAASEFGISLGFNDAVVLGLDGLFQDADPGGAQALAFRLESSDAGVEARIVGRDLMVRGASIGAGSARVVVVGIDPTGAEARLVLRVQFRGRQASGNRPPNLSGWAWTGSGSAPAPLPDPALGVWVLSQPEGHEQVLRLRGEDPDGDPVTFGLIGPDAPRFRIDADGWVRVRQPLDREHPIDTRRVGVHRLAVTVQDARGAQRIQPLEIRVDNRVEGPVVRPGRRLLWVSPEASPSAQREYRIGDHFLDPEGGVLSASLQNAGDLARWGLEATLDGDRLRLRRSGDMVFRGQALLKLSLTARGMIRDFEVRLMPDTDGDGVDDLTETLAGDLDQDGVADARQSSMASLPWPATRPQNADPDIRGSIEAEPGSCLGLTLEPSGSAPTGPTVPAKIAGVRLEFLSPDTRSAWADSLAHQEGVTLAGQERSLWFALEAGDGSVDVTSLQQTVRLILPPGSGIDGLVVQDGQGRCREFLQQPELDGEGRPRIDARGRPLVTGSEFRPASASWPFDEIRVHLVDNGRGDEDPTPGRILVAGLIAALERREIPPPPSIDPPASPTRLPGLVLHGSAVPGLRVRLWEAAILQAEVRANADGRWRWEPVAAPGAGFHRFTASALAGSGVESLPSAEVWLTIPGPLTAVADTLERGRPAVQRWSVSDLLDNDHLPNGAPGFALDGRRSELGGAVDLEGDQVVYRAPAGLPEAATDSFGYEIRYGSETSRARVRLVGASPAAGERAASVRWLEPGGSLQVRFLAEAGRRFRLMSSPSMQPSTPWEERARLASDPSGLVIWTDLQPTDAGRFYRLEPLP
ncbi:MAG: MBG domain-containing protein, partial [Verrucomicrobium sp.]|nr:MBG domain-containing protein [Verrucomicrobium sp.]